MLCCCKDDGESLSEHLMETNALMKHEKDSNYFPHPSDSQIALTSHTALFPPGKIIHVVRNHPKNSRYSLCTVKMYENISMIWMTWSSVVQVTSDYILVKYAETQYIHAVALYQRIKLILHVFILLNTTWKNVFYRSICLEMWVIMHGSSWNTNIFSFKARMTCHLFLYSNVLNLGAHVNFINSPEEVEHKSNSNWDCSNIFLNSCMQDWVSWLFL